MGTYYIPQNAEPVEELEVNTGEGLDVNPDIFFGKDVGEIEKLKGRAFLGYLTMNVVDPPDGALWGVFNDRPIKPNWVKDLIKDYARKIVQTESTAMQIAVKRHWIANITEAEGIKSLDGIAIANVPEMKLTSEGEVEIPQVHLWVMGGNHRRLALKAYIDNLKTQFQKLEKKSVGKAKAKVEENQKKLQEMKDKVEKTSPNWVVELYDRGGCADIDRECPHSKVRTNRVVYAWIDVVESSGSDTLGDDWTYPTFRYMSRNETLGHYKATEEELLLEIVDHLKLKLVDDLRAIPDSERGDHFDYQGSCKQYKDALDAHANKYKMVNSGFRRLALVPSFMLALAMMSRVRRQFVHATWFRSSALLKMVNIHGRVSPTPPHQCRQ